MSQVDRLTELAEQAANAMAAGLIDDTGDPELVEMTDIITDLLERQVAGSVEERDRMTLERLKLVAAAVEAALKAMPNNTSSMFAVQDVRDLSQIQRMLHDILLSEHTRGETHG